MQWRKHVRIKYGGRVGVGQGQREREQVQLQVRVVQLQREGGARLSYVCHQPQLSSTARRSCSAAAMLCCGRRKVSAVERAGTRPAHADRARARARAPVTVNGDGGTIGDSEGGRKSSSRGFAKSFRRENLLFSARKSRALEEPSPRPLRSLRGASEILPVDSAKISTGPSYR